MEKEIRIKVVSGPPELVVIGVLYAAPAPTAHPNGVSFQRVMRGLWVPYDLKPAKYTFKFKTKNTAHHFELGAYDGATSLATKKFKAPQDDATFSFEVKS